VLWIGALARGVQQRDAGSYVPGGGCKYQPRAVVIGCMRFGFNEEQEALRSAARSFLENYSSSARVRDAMESERGYDPEVWRRIGQELGWPSVIIPEAYGGSGLTHVELVGLMEEMGKALLCAPFFSSVCLAANALLVGAHEEQKREYLPGLASGETIGTLACTGPRGCWDPSGIDVRVKTNGAEVVLDGDASFVTDGHTAHLLIVAARHEGTPVEEGVSLFVVPADTPGMERRLLPTMDQTRKQAEVTFRDVRLPMSALIGEEGEGWPVLRKTLDLAAVALAAEQVGGAQRCLDASVAYAKERVQFRRPIGSFQAIKHKCADMLLRVESARSASYYAGWVAAIDDGELPAIAALAKAYCSEAYFHCAAESIQIHGGVGFTWEYDVHLYFKRARATEAFLGTPTRYRERIAREIGL
jgi:alkylation response protein AidB-like acyl-CoA dehydrogenase